jgi:hypothetical protein
LRAGEGRRGPERVGGGWRGLPYVVQYIRLKKAAVSWRLSELVSLTLLAARTFEYNYAIEPHMQKIINAPANKH